MNQIKLSCNLNDSRGMFDLSNLAAKEEAKEEATTTRCQQCRGHWAADGAMKRNKSNQGMSRKALGPVSLNARFGRSLRLFIWGAALCSFLDVSVAMMKGWSVDIKLQLVNVLQCRLRWQHWPMGGCERRRNQKCVRATSVGLVRFKAAKKSTLNGARML
jgi:hypothetical protein